MGRRQALALTALLLAAALALGLLLIRSAEGGRVLIATRDLAAGEAISSSDFSQAAAKLAPGATGYLAVLPSGTVLTRSLRRGELLNQVQLVSASDSGLVRIALDPTQPIASDVRVGARVSLWFMPKQAISSVESKQASAGQIASDVQVLQILKNTDALGSAKTRLEIEVSPQLVPAILAMQAQDGNLSVIAQG